MLILGIESSCDETGVALVASAPIGVPVLRAHALYSQIEMHQAYGGVVPELASRDHIRRVLPLTDQVLRRPGAGWGTWTWWPTRAALVWPARCWWARAWPVRWAPRWTARCWACTTWRGTCCRLS